MNHSEIVNFLSGVADLIRDTFKRGKYQDVILPLTVLRRLDCVLAGTKDRVLKRQAELKGRGLEDMDEQLRRADGVWRGAAHHVPVAPADIGAPYVPSQESDTCAARSRRIAHGCR